MITAGGEPTEVGFGWLATAGPIMLWLIVLTFIFVQCALIIGLFLPGGTLLFAAGVVLAEQDAEVQAWSLSGATLIAAVSGNLTGYLIGAKTGTVLSARRAGRVLNADNVNRVRRWLDRRGFIAVVAARWVPWMGTLAPLVAGAAGMGRRRFLAASIVGALLWVPTVVLSGYYAAGLLTFLPGWLHTTVVWLVVGMLVIGTGYGLLRYRHEMRTPIVESPKTWGS
ncbi:MAG: DedA family protein [Micromonosporaceae bacterium]